MDTYVRKVGSEGRIFLVNPNHPGTKALLARGDIVRYDEGQGQNRIAALKKRLKDLEDHPEIVLDPKISNEAQEIARLEAEVAAKEQSILKKALEEQGIETDDEIPLTQIEKDKADREKIIDEDPEIKKIDAMSTKQEVIDYVLEYYGLAWALESNKKLEVYKNEAITLRIDRLFESVD